MPIRPLPALAAAVTAFGLVAAAAGAATPKGSTHRFNGVPVEELPGAASPASRAAQEAAAGVLSRKVVVPSSSAGKRDGRLSVLAGRKWVHLRNGGRVDLADGLSAEVYLDPYPPGTAKLWLDVHLVHSASGKPVTGARATMAYDMQSHTMGRRSAQAEDTGDGHYLYTIDYGMFGEWGHTLSIRSGKITHELRLLVEALPGV